MQLEPNEARVTTWFGKYNDAFSQTRLLLDPPVLLDKEGEPARPTTIDAEPIKVNDKTGVRDDWSGAGVES